MKSIVRAIIAILLLSFSACGGNSITKPGAQATKQPGTTKSTATNKKPSQGGGYYLDDGPDETPVNVDAVPNAVPKVESLLVRANKPYSALGQRYQPMTIYQPYKKQGIASWYGKRYHGKKTSSGEVYDMYGMSAAHTILPIPSYVRVTNPATGASVIVRVNDRGPFKHDRLIDLSYAAAYKLNLIASGSGLVEVEIIDPRSSASVDKTVNTTANLNAAAADQVANSQQSNSDSQNAAQQKNTLQYYVQAGAFKSEANADLLKRKVQALQLAENVGVASVYNNGLYRVKLGPFQSKNDADVSASNIRKQLNLSAIVTSQ